MAMRQIAKLSTFVAAAATMLWSSGSEAAFFGLPRALAYHLERIGLDKPALPPLGHTFFCLSHPDDCKVNPTDFRRRNIALTEERWNELNLVNRAVNRSIAPDENVTDEWQISPKIGNCKDYAITKRHELLVRGWPSRALLLSEVIVPSGAHHLILVVRTKDADLVLDNLNANIRPAAMTFHQYHWVRIESPQNPKFWASVSIPSTDRTAMASDDPGNS
jgi:predicted transglutaminase-like cysteine proteinase